MSRSGSTPSPYWLEMSTIFLRAPAPIPARPSAPSTTFSSTVKLSASMKCWCTMPIPAWIAWWGEWMVVALPSMRISPSSGRCIPYRIFMRVDLPAPFSPTIAWIVPRETLRKMSWLATTPGKRLVIPRSSTAG